MDSWLEALTASPVSDEDTQMHAAIGMVETYMDSVSELKAFGARNKHRFVRYNTIQELSRKGSGETRRCWANWWLHRTSR